MDATIPAALNCTLSQVGPCAHCRRPCHRYGKGASPLCRTCRTEREAALQAAK
ncbi:hypothetical protein [Streptomyces sp. 3N207]|uniref:hypothetical protein n=1 Tax=Streptomyces sp. 3N207 TaxID=3457417 RepID=UPI003FD3FEAB